MATIQHTLVNHYIYVRFRLHESYRLLYWNKNGLRYICVKGATVWTIGMRIFGNKGYGVQSNLLFVIRVDLSQFGAFEPQPLGKNIPYSYT